MNRSSLIKFLTDFALISDSEGYDWAEVYSGDWLIEDLSTEQLETLYKHVCLYLSVK